MSIGLRWRTGQGSGAAPETRRWGGPWFGRRDMARSGQGRPAAVNRGGRIRGSRRTLADDWSGTVQPGRPGPSPGLPARADPRRGHLPADL